MSKKATYSAIIEALSKKTGKSKQLSDDFVKDLIELVKDDLKENGKSAITNFGSFKVKDVAEREGKNPQTGEPITIPAHKRVSFSPYKALKETVNKPYAHLESRVIEEEEEEDKQEEIREPVAAPIPPAAEPEPEEKKEKEPEIKAEPVAGSSKKSKSFKPGRPVKKKRASSAKYYLLLILILSVVVVGGGYLLSDYYLTDQQASGNQLPVPGELAIEEDPEESTEADPSVSSETGDPAASEAEQETAMEADEPVSNETPVASETKEEPVDPVEESPKADTETTAESAPETEGITRGQEGYQPVYRPLSDENYWDIAQKMYGKAYLWPLIFAENKTVEDNPDRVFAWRSLSVPKLENPDNMSPESYLKLAEATELVANAYEAQGLTKKAEMYYKYADTYRNKAE